MKRTLWIPNQSTKFDLRADTLDSAKLSDWNANDNKYLLRLECKPDELSSLMYS